MKQKTTKITQLFEGRKRKAHLVRWEHLKNKAGEPRIKLDLILPLLNEPVIGMNGPISDTYIVMAKEDSKVGRATLNLYAEGMTLDCFDTEGQKKASISSQGCSFFKFQLEASGEGEKRTLNLHAVVYVAASIGFRDWAWDHRGSDFWLEAVYSQSEMEFVSDEEKDEKESDEDSEGDEEDEDSDEEEDELEGQERRRIAKA